MSMNKFAKILKEETALSPIMEGKTRIDTSEVIAKYPDGVTITGFDFINQYDSRTGETKSYPVLTFAENPNECFFGGLVMNKICRAWVNGYESPAQASDDLAKDGGVKIKLEYGRTKNGNNITNVILVD